jgi:hypothetical protein
MPSLVSECAGQQGGVRIAQAVPDPPAAQDGTSRLERRHPISLEQHRRLCLGWFLPLHDW